MTTNFNNSKSKTCKYIMTTNKQQNTNTKSNNLSNINIYSDIYSVLIRIHCY